MKYFPILVNIALSGKISKLGNYYVAQQVGRSKSNVMLDSFVELGQPLPGVLTQPGGGVGGTEHDEFGKHPGRGDVLLAGKRCFGGADSHRAPWSSSWPTPRGAGASARGPEQRGYAVRIGRERASHELSERRLVGPKII